jgi:serine kinase of HPr protein (carbohydrate metabolism regulator)
MVDLPAIIISEGRAVTHEMIERANNEHIAILQTTRKTHEVVIDLFQRGFL